MREASKLGTNEPRAKKSAMQDADTCPGEYVDAGFQNKKLTQKCGLFVLVNSGRRSVSGQVCQTVIIRTRFSAADFRLNRVIRLANTVKY